MSEKDSCPLCGLWPHAAGCPARLIEYGPIPELDFPAHCGFDEPWPFNLSRTLWLWSGESQRQFEAEVLAHGRN